MSDRTRFELWDGRRLVAEIISGPVAHGAEEAARAAATYCEQLNFCRAAGVSLVTIVQVTPPAGARRAA